MRRTSLGCFPLRTSEPLLLLCAHLEGHGKAAFLGCVLHWGSWKWLKCGLVFLYVPSSAGSSPTCVARSRGAALSHRGAGIWEGLITHVSGYLVHCTRVTNSGGIRIKCT